MNIKPAGIAALKALRTSASDLIFIPNNQTTRDIAGRPIFVAAKLGRTFFGITPDGIVSRLWPDAK